jgi:hypothetical protein
VAGKADAFNWYNKDTADNLVAAQSWTRYDALIAIPRLSEQFARRDLHLTFFVPGWVIVKYPAQISCRDRLLSAASAIYIAQAVQKADPASQPPEIWRISVQGRGPR